MATVIKPAQAKQQEIQTIADAERYKLETVARGQADATKNIGHGEAEAMAKKAEAWRAYNEAAIAQMFIERLPEIVRAVAEPLAKVEKIVIVNTGGGDGGAGASKITKDIVDIVAQVSSVLEATSGVNLKTLTEQFPKLLKKEGGETGSGGGRKG